MRSDPDRAVCRGHRGPLPASAGRRACVRKRRARACSRAGCGEDRAAGDPARPHREAPQKRPPSSRRRRSSARCRCRRRHRHGSGSSGSTTMALCCTSSSASGSPAAGPLALVPLGAVEMPHVPIVAAAAEGDVDRVAGAVGTVDRDVRHDACERKRARPAHRVELRPRPCASRACRSDRRHPPGCRHRASSPTRRSAI